MKDYLVTIVTVSVCVGIYKIISPQFAGIEKYSKMIGMLIVLAILVSPLNDFLGMLDGDTLESLKENIINSENAEENQYDRIFKDYLASFSVDELKNEIEYVLLKEYDIPNDECEVSVSTELIDGNLHPSHIQILLSGKSIFKNPYTIEDYFATLLECTCSVLIK